MLQNNLITIFLSFHDILSSFKGLRTQGKQSIAKICDLLIQNQILKNSDKNQQISPIQKSLYQYAIQQIHIEITNQIITFESSYLQKLYVLKQSLATSQKVLLNMIQKLDKNWLLQKNTPFKLDLYQLTNILPKLVFNYKKQIELITEKWNQLAKNLISNNNLNNVSIEEDTKLFMLHVSFETYVEDGLLNTWDNIMIGLQNKRYK